MSETEVPDAATEQRRARSDDPLAVIDQQNSPFPIAVNVLGRRRLPAAIDLWRNEFYDRVDATQEALAMLICFLHDNEIAQDEQLAHAGIVGICRASFDRFNRFDFDDEDGEPAVVMEVLGEDGFTAVDLVAWPVTCPQAFALALGRGGLLGILRLPGHANAHAGEPVPMWRTPLRWLQEGCQGVVVLQGIPASLVLRSAPCPLRAEDLSHARWLVKSGAVRKDQLRVPVSSVGFVEVAA